MYHVPLQFQQTLHVSQAQSIESSSLATAPKLRPHRGDNLTFLTGREHHDISDISRGEEQAHDTYGRMHNHWRRGIGGQGPLKQLAPSMTEL